MNNNINLLEKRKNRIAALRDNKLRILRAIAVTLLFVVSAFSIILFLLISLSPLPQLKRQEQQAIIELSQYHPEMAKIALLHERTDTIKDILSQRQTFDSALEDLQSKLPPGVDVDTLNMSKKNISIGVSSKSLESLDVFIDALVKAVQNKKGFSQVTLSSLSVDIQKNVYLLTVRIVTL